MKWQKPLRLFWRENYSEKPGEVVKEIDLAVQKSLDAINLYPASLYDDVVQQIATFWKVKSDQVILGHGTEGLIHLTCQTFLNKESAGGMIDPSFFVFANNLTRYKNFKYKVEFGEKVDVDDLIEKIKHTKLFWLASPNTATGNYLFSKNDIEKVLKNYNGLFCVDECYFGIGYQTVTDLVDKYKNLAVLNGVTKVMGMPSIRLGYLISNKENIDKLKHNQNDMELDPINTFSLNIFSAAFRHFKSLAKVTNKFEDDFVRFMRNEFPETTITKTLVTFHFMDLKPYKKEAYRIINYMNDQGFEMSSKQLSDNSSLSFPEYLEIVPPPKAYWDEYSKRLRRVLTT